MEHVAAIVLRSSILIKSLSFVYLYFDVCWLSAIYFFDHDKITTRGSQQACAALPLHPILYGVLL